MEDFSKEKIGKKDYMKLYDFSKITQNLLKSKKKMIE